MFKLDLEKAEEPEIKLSTYAGSAKKRVPKNYLLEHRRIHAFKLWCGEDLRVPWTAGRSKSPS